MFCGKRMCSLPFSVEFSWEKYKFNHKKRWAYVNRYSLFLYFLSFICNACINLVNNPIFGRVLRNLLFLVTKMYLRFITIPLRGDVSRAERVELLSTPKSCSVCRCVPTYKLPQVMRRGSYTYVLVRRPWCVGRRPSGRWGGVRHAASATARRAHAHHGPLDWRQLQQLRPAPLRLPALRCLELRL